MKQLTFILVLIPSVRERFILVVRLIFRACGKQDDFVTGRSQRLVTLDRRVAPWLSLSFQVEVENPLVAKQKQLAEKTVGSRDRCTSRVCSRIVDGVAQGCNIGSASALA